MEMIFIYLNKDKILNILVVNRHIINKENV